MRSSVATVEVFSTQGTHRARRADIVQRLGPPPWPDAVVHAGPCMVCREAVECWSRGPLTRGTAFYCGDSRCSRKPAPITGPCACGGAGAGVYYADGRLHRCTCPARPAPGALWDAAKRASGGV